MVLPRFFHATYPFHVDSIISLDQRETHHLKAVRRIGPGEQVLLFNGCGELAVAAVISPREGSCRILSVEVHDRPAFCSFGLAFLQPHHLDIAIEKMTELGVGEIVLFPGDKSDRRTLSSSGKRRLHALMVAAMKQSSQLFYPKLNVVDSFEEAIAQLPSPYFWLDPDQSLPLFSRSLISLKKGVSLSVFVGPESGWSAQEKEMLSRKGEAVLLHPNVLRAETAAMVAAYQASLWVQGW